LHLLLYDNTPVPSPSFFVSSKRTNSTKIATTMSWMDKMKKAGKSVVDAGAKTMLKVGVWLMIFCGHWSECATVTRGPLATGGGSLAMRQAKKGCLVAKSSMVAVLVGSHC